MANLQSGSRNSQGGKNTTKAKQAKGKKSSAKSPAPKPMAKTASNPGPRRGPRKRLLGTVRDEGPNPIDVHVGQRMRLRRMSISMTQQELAGALGVTFQQVQKYERGANRIGASRLFDIAEVLDAPMQFFFDGMGGDTERQSPRKRIGAAEPPVPPLAQEPQFDKPSLDLLRAFNEISDPALKRRVLDLCKALARGDL